MDWIHTVDTDMVRERCALGYYDYIIVGSGFGGGVLAEQLVKEPLNQSRVLLIEKGGLMFSTHVLNTPRPDYHRGTDDSPEGNEIVYAAVKQTIKTAENSEPYVGGPVYCLGGRSNVWGLWTPQGYRPTLDKHFPKEIAKYLTTTGYTDAFNLLTNYSQTNALYPQGYIAESQITKSKTKLQKVLKDKGYLVEDGKVGIGPVASEFHSPRPYRFPQGAYSTTVPLMNRIYASDQFLTVLMRTEVLRFNAPDLKKNQSVKYLTLRSRTNQQVYRLEIPEGTTVILSAGTLGTAQIALNSGLQFRNPLVGKGLIDHEVWALRFAKEKTQQSIDPLLLQCMIKICDDTALLTVTINANYLLSSGGSGAPLPISQFLDKNGVLLGPKGSDPVAYKDQERDKFLGNSGETFDYFNENKIIKKFDTMQILLEYSAELDNLNEVLNIPDLEPVIRIRRRFNTHTTEKYQQQMQDLATVIRDAFRDSNFASPGPGPALPPASDPTSLPFGRKPLPFERNPPPFFPDTTSPEKLPDHFLPLPVKEQNIPAPRLQLLGFGVFSHEVGTMRMPGPTGASVVDKNLKVDGFRNLYACDLSVFPVSLQANPTLTLTALSMRLAEHLGTLKQAETATADAEP